MVGALYGQRSIQILALSDRPYGPMPGHADVNDVTPDPGIRSHCTHPEPSKLTVAKLPLGQVASLRRGSQLTSLTPFIL